MSRGTASRSHFRDDPSDVLLFCRFDNICIDCLSTYPRFGAGPAYLPVDADTPRIFLPPVAPRGILLPIHGTAASLSHAQLSLRRARERLVDLYRARGKRIPPLFAEALELRRQELIQDTEREMMAPFQGLSRPRWGSASVLLPYNPGEEDVFRCEAPDPVVRPSTPTPGAGASFAGAGTICMAPVPRRPEMSPIALVDDVPPPSSDELVRADTPDAADHEDEDLFDEMVDVIILDDSDEELLDEDLDSSGSSAESV